MITAPWLSSCLLAITFAGDTTPDQATGFVLFRQEPASSGENLRTQIDPITAPFLFESPWIHSGVRPTVLYHRFPETGFFGGGDLRGFAIQARLAITENLAFIATKDGFIDLNPGQGQDETGFADIAGGFKYAITVDEESGLTLTPGFTIELSQGDREVLQGAGDGVLRPFVSAGAFISDFQVSGNVGASFPFDDDESQFVDYHIQGTCEVAKGIFPVVEINGITYTKDGDALPVNFEGLDYTILGSNDVAGNTVVTGALGARILLDEKIHLGFAYEVPLTHRKDIFRDRVTLDVMIRF